MQKDVIEKLEELLQYEVNNGYNIDLFREEWDKIIPPYKTYHTTIHHDKETDTFTGWVIGYTDLSYSASTIELLEKAFHNAVDTYKEICRKELFGENNK